VRGAVDFIPLGQIRYNVADVFIACGTLLFAVAVAAGTLSTNRPPPRPPYTRQHRRRTWLSGVASAMCLVVVVGFGAVNYGGVTTPTPSSSENTDR